MKDIHYIDEEHLEHKRILIRVDYNVSLNADHSIGNDERIRQSLPTLLYLLKHHNKLVLLAHLGSPKGIDPTLSLKRVANDLQKLLPDYTITLVKDFHAKEPFEKQTEKEILLIENIRFFPGEQENYPAFAQELSVLGEIYVNDAFSVSHREAASVVGLPHLLPSYGGLLLKKEVETLTKALKDPQKPFVAILGGAKVSSKIHLITKLIEVADTILIGGGMANTFFRSAGLEVGKSFYEPDALAQAKQLLHAAERHHTELILPQDVVVGEGFTATEAVSKRLGEIGKKDQILDIGPETEALFGNKIAEAKTIVWNGPVGYFENPTFRHGTDFLYYAISENNDALSIIGGGETLAAVSKKEHLEKISHISTGGGAMLEFMEKGTLPGIEALER